MAQYKLGHSNDSMTCGNVGCVESEEYDDDFCWIWHVMCVVSILLYLLYFLFSSLRLAKAGRRETANKTTWSSLIQVMPVN